MRISWRWFAVGAVISIACTLIAQPRIGPPMPSVPALPRVIAVVTNGEEVIEVRVKKAVSRVDMPPALTVSPNAPHFYYGVAEFRRTKAGFEVENEVFSFGKFNSDELFMQSQSVGNPVFNKRYKAVFKCASQLPSDIECIWQRRDGVAP